MSYSTFTHKDYQGLDKDRDCIRTINNLDTSVVLSKRIHAVNQVYYADPTVNVDYGWIVDHKGRLKGKEEARNMLILFAGKLGSRGYRDIEGKDLIQAAQSAHFDESLPDDGPFSGHIDFTIAVPDRDRFKQDFVAIQEEISKETAREGLRTQRKQSR